jgi:hypothetical protein
LMSAAKLLRKAKHGVSRMPDRQRDATILVKLTQT